MIVRNNIKEERENEINKMQKNLDKFIQNSLNKFKFADVKKELYSNVGDDVNSIISHKSTIPDLVIWNKPFNKNECFKNMKESKEYNKYPRVPFYLRLNNKEENNNIRKNINSYKKVEEQNNTYENLVDFVDKLNISQKDENNSKERKIINIVEDINKVKDDISYKQNNKINVNYNDNNIKKTSNIIKMDDKSGNDSTNRDILNNIKYINEKEKDNKVNKEPQYKSDNNYITPVNKTKKIMNDYYQNQFRQNELLMNYVYSYLDKKGWIIFKNGGDYLSNFTSFELFTFLTNALKSKNDLKMFIIGMQTDSMMFNGEQIYIILSQTLPIILQKKQLEYEIMRKKKIKECDDKKLLKIKTDEKENISDNYLPQNYDKNRNTHNKNVFNMNLGYNA